jgi:ribonuclease HI
LANNEVEIWTDGGCRGNPGPGGWAALLIAGGREKVVSGAEPQTTNNRMELTAAIRGLQALKRPCTVQLYTDSEYLRRGISEWLPRWKARNWTTAAREPVKNADLWRELDTVNQLHSVSWHWVPAHSGVVNNERVDGLVNAAIDALLR